MARLSSKEPISEPDVTPEGETPTPRKGEPEAAAPVAEPETAPQIASAEAPASTYVDGTWKIPDALSLLGGARVDVDALLKRVDELTRQFPLGIPEGLLVDALENAISTRTLYARLGEVLVAWNLFRQTGKGPVGHAPVEVA